MSTFLSVSPPLPPTYPDQSDLTADAEAMQRLVGKNTIKQKKEEVNFIEVNQDDLKPDTREWLTKALTEEPERGPKNEIKGERKRKHQITYLAAMAKEREHELRQAWAANSQARRAAANKYGF